MVTLTKQWDNSTDEFSVTYDETRIDSEIVISATPLSPQSPYRRGTITFRDTKGNVLNTITIIQKSDVHYDSTKYSGAYLID